MTQLTEPRYLLVDGGQSACKVAITTKEGGIQAVGRAIGIRASDGDPVTVWVDAVTAGAQEIEADSGGLTVDGACLGLSGRLTPGERERLASRIHDLTGAPRVHICGDLLTAYVGALGFAAGACVVAGTGTAALAISPDGEWATADGWGYLLGDAGSGFAVGREGLATAMRAHDGRPGGSRLLLRLAVDRFGHGPAELPRHIYAAPHPVAMTASFATAVSEAARQGDQEAVRILRNAGEELGATAGAAISAASASWQAAPTVSWAGGLFNVAEYLLPSLEQALREGVPSARLAKPQGGPLDGALTLCIEGTEHVSEALIDSFDFV